MWSHRVPNLTALTADVLTVLYVAFWDPEFEVRAIDASNVDCPASYKYFNFQCDILVEIQRTTHHEYTRFSPVEPCPYQRGTDNLSTLCLVGIPCTTLVLLGRVKLQPFAASTTLHSMGFHNLNVVLVFQVLPALSFGLVHLGALGLFLRA